jgi:arsenate reductase (thioredoxin)
VPDRVYNVLFLCTGNSARSIIAEAILNREGHGKFKAFSAGSHPKGAVNPQALDLLRKFNHDVSTLRSKSWAEFAQAGSPDLDFVFTVCDNAAGEACPIWPGQPITAHWGIRDPAGATGSEAEIALVFRDAYRMLNRRIELFLALPIQKLDRMVLTTRLKAIGGSEGATEKVQHVDV